MKPYPFSNFISSLYGFIWSTASTSMVPGIHSAPSSRGQDISDVFSSVAIGEGSYWDPRLKDEVSASWLASGREKYFALFNKSNTWDYHQFIEHVNSSGYQRPSSHIGVITYGGVAPAVPDAWDSFSGVIVNNDKWASGIRDHGFTSIVGPGGKVAVKCPLSRDDQTSGIKLTEYFWSPDTDHLDVYYVSVDDPKSEKATPPILDFKSNSQDESEVRVLLGIYYSKVIRGEHSPEVFSVYGGSANFKERRQAIREFIGKYMRAERSNRNRSCRDKGIAGCAFAQSASLHLYNCDYHFQKFWKVKSIEL